MTKCCICGYTIKTKKNDIKVRQDTMSFQLHGKWICGMCIDDILMECINVANKDVWNRLAEDRE